jgi:hypothetical protein
MVPLRLLMVAGQRRLALREGPARSLRIGLALVPTLVFGLVIAGILRETFGVPRAVFGGLVIYTLGNTLIPGFALRAAPEFEPHAPELNAPPEPPVTDSHPTAGAGAAG